MTRNLKVLGLALMAAFAMSAVVASAASAQNGKLTSDGPVTLTGTELAGNAFHFGEGLGLPATKCNDSTFHGGKLNGTTGGVHQLLPSGESNFTFVPKYKECKVGFLPATVDMTSCDFVFTLGATTGGGATYGITSHLECSVPGDTVHLTAFSDAGHTNRVCSITFGAQTNIPGLHATNVAGGTVLVNGTATGITATHLNEPGCPGHVHSAIATYVVNVEVKGDNAAGQATGISISD
jgi:hypothetical protein